MHFLLAVSGFSGIGKDEFCKPFVKQYSAVQIGLADPAKRHIADIYGFTEEQLFGPSKFRNRGDIRYPKPGISLTLTPWTDVLPYELIDPTIDNPLDPEKKYWIYPGRTTDTKFNNTHPNITIDTNNNRLYFVEEGNPDYWLSPRESLQKYCELMNTLYGDTWIRKAIEIHLAFATGQYNYTKMGGLSHLLPCDYWDGFDIFTYSADIRHWHEIRALRAINKTDCIPILIRLRSKRIPNPPYDHRSETEQVTIPDSEFNFIVNNDYDVEQLHIMAGTIAAYITDSNFKLENLHNYKTIIL